MHDLNDFTRKEILVFLHDVSNEPGYVIGLGANSGVLL